MKTESLARKFRPAGFEQPEGSRREYTKPSPELQEAFDKWVSGLPDDKIYLPNTGEQYKKAKILLHDLGDISHREANSLLADFKPKSKGERSVGIFLSACYNWSSDSVIIFDGVNEDVDYIGYCLKEGKILVNNGEAGNRFGCDSSGIIISNGTVGMDLGLCSSSGIFVLTGVYSGKFSHERFLRSTISLRSPEGHAIGHVSFPQTDLKNDTIPRLEQYFEKFCEDAKVIKDDESAKSFIERYGNGESIQKEIKRMLR